MSAEIIAWLRSPEGEAWSRARSAASTTDTPSWMAAPLNTQDVAEDPCGRPPLAAEDAAAPGSEAVR
jgi:hypothetical protein